MILNWVNKRLIWSDIGTTQSEEKCHKKYYEILRILVSVELGLINFLRGHPTKRKRMKNDGHQYELYDRSQWQTQEIFVESW